MSGAIAAAPLLPAADFYFTRLSYTSGDWSANARLPALVLRALAHASTMRVDPAERVAALGDAAMLSAPFCYLAGHRLLQFTPAERAHAERYVRGGGFLLVDDCARDPEGVFARSFEAEIARLFGPRAWHRLPPAHALQTSFYRVDGRDDLRALELDGRVRVLYSNGGVGVRLAVNIIHYALGA